MQRQTERLAERFWNQSRLKARLRINMTKVNSINKCRDRSRCKTARKHAHTYTGLSWDCTGHCNSKSEHFFIGLQTFLNKLALLSCVVPSPPIIQDTHCSSCSTWHTFSQNTPMKPETAFDKSRVWLRLLTATQINGKTTFQNFHSSN